jgi:hypothetical protein
MPLLDLQKLTVGLSRTWAGFLRDWDRSLRAGNYPETTRYNYLLAAAQLGRYLTEQSPDPDAADAAQPGYAIALGRAGLATASASDAEHGGGDHSEDAGSGTHPIDDAGGYWLVLAVETGEWCRMADSADENGLIQARLPRGMAGVAGDSA